jgi:hypothetical protein
VISSQNGFDSIQTGDFSKQGLSRYNQAGGMLVLLPGLKSRLRQSAKESQICDSLALVVHVSQLLLTNTPDWILRSCFFVQQRSFTTDAAGYLQHCPRAG